MAPLIALGATLLPSLIEIIAGDRAGRVASTVAEAVVQATGTDDATAAERALASKPELLAQLKQRLAEIALEERRLQVDADRQQLQAMMADMASARGQTVALAQAGSHIAWAAPIVSVIITAGFFTVVVMLFLVDRRWDERGFNLLNVLLGALTIGFGQVSNYWLGSSAGSANKDRALQAAAMAPPQGGGYVPQGPAVPPPAFVPNQPSSVATPPSPPGTTADDLNARSLAAARGQR